MKVDMTTVKKVVGYVGYFGASSAVGAVIFSTVRNSHPVLQIAGYVGGVGLGMAAGDVAREKLITTLDKI